MKYYFLMLISLLFFFSKNYAQKSLFDDPNVVFKNKEGKVLTKEEISKFGKGPFKMKTEVIDSVRKEITIIPISQKEIETIEQEKEKYVNKIKNKPLPEFNFQDINGNVFQLSNLKGKVVVLNFWFIECKPCVAEIPALNRVVKSRPDIVFLAPTFNSKEDVKKFLEHHPFNYNVISDASNYTDKLKISNYPTHIIIDKEGIVKDVILGGDTNHMDEILKKKIEAIK